MCLWHRKEFCSRRDPIKFQRDAILCASCRQRSAVVCLNDFIWYLYIDCLFDKRNKKKNKKKKTNAHHVAYQNLSVHFIGFSLNIKLIESYSTFALQKKEIQSVKNRDLITYTAQSARVVKYTDCTPVEGVRLPLMSVMYMKLNNLMVRLQ